MPKYISDKTFKTTKHILEVCPEARDNVNKLVFNVLLRDLPEILRQDEKIKALFHWLANVAVPVESISRAGRKIQAENINLQGKKREKRLRKSKEVAKEVRPERQVLKNFKMCKFSY
jgi:hypothetical protein